jgi:hypothetical protein
MLDAWRITILGATIVALVGCTAAGQSKDAERSAVRKEVAAEVERICALPEREREAELKKVKDESGLDLYCAK